MTAYYVACVAGVLSTAGALLVVILLGRRGRERAAEVTFVVAAVLAVVTVVACLIGWGMGL